MSFPYRVSLYSNTVGISNIYRLVDITINHINKLVDIRRIETFDHNILIRHFRWQVFPGQCMSFNLFAGRRYRTGCIIDIIFGNHITVHHICHMIFVDRKSTADNNIVCRHNRWQFAPTAECITSLCWKSNGSDYSPGR